MSGEEGEGRKGRKENLDEALLARKTLDFVLIFLKELLPPIGAPIIIIIIIFVYPWLSHKTLVEHELPS